ncbi:MAG: hypothetical protein WD969_10515, partial [Paracoccaceae bacterium]
MNEMRPPGPAFAATTITPETEAERDRRVRRKVERLWRWFSLALPDASSVMFRQKLTDLDVARGE